MSLLPELNPTRGAPEGKMPDCCLVGSGLQGLLSLFSPTDPWKPVDPLSYLSPCSFARLHCHSIYIYSVIVFLHCGNSSFVVRCLVTRNGNIYILFLNKSNVCLFFLWFYALLTQGVLVAKGWMFLPGDTTVTPWLVEIRLSHGNTGKAFQGPTHGRSWCGKMAYLCGRLPLGFQCLLSLCLTMEKVQLCPQQSQIKASVEFLLHIEVQSFWSPHHLLRAPVAARPAWSHAPGWERTHVNAWGLYLNMWVRGRERKRERESKLLCSSGIILMRVWNGSGAFSKEEINFPSFHGVLDRFTPCSLTDRLLQSNTSLCTLPTIGTGGGGEDC